MTLHRRTRALLIVVSIAFALTLAGCGGDERPETIVAPKDVLKPVAVTCVSATLSPTRPEYPDTDAALIAAVDAAERYRLVTLGRSMRDSRLGELEPVVEGCRK